MNKRYGSLLMLVFLFATALSAQKAKMNHANLLFDKLNYKEAAKEYLYILDKRDNSEAKMKLAECYRKMNDMQEAEYWFGQVVLLPEAEPIQKLYYAMALQANGKCDLAVQWFKEYNKLVPNDNRGRLLAQACEKTVQSDLLEAGSLYQVKHLEDGINTAYSDFGAALTSNGFVFASEKDNGVAVKRTFAWTARPFLDLYYTKSALVDEQTMEFKYSQPEKYYKGDLGTKFHDGPVSLSKDGKEIFFTRNNILDGKIARSDKGIIGLKIMSATLDGNDWKDVKGVPFNSDEYNVCHPALSADGTKLFFASDLPGGFGGMDLYVSFMESGRWAPPINLGSTINTEGNEVFPFIHEDGTLFYSSDGLAGLGGLDVYATREKGGVWEVPGNIGFPINSNKDDFGLVFNAEKTFGYFSSDRDGGAGLDDIYSFTKFAASVEVLVFDKRSGAPLANSTVTTPCFKGKTYTTDKAGKVVVEIPLNRGCDFTANKAPYVENTVVASSRGFNSGDKISLKIPLDRVLDFAIGGKVTDKDKGTPIPGAKIVLDNDCGDASQTATAGADGSYNFVVKENCCYVIRVSNDKYLTNAQQLCVKNKLESENIKLDVPLTRYLIDTITTGPFVLEHIYYNFNKANLREDASTGLNELLKILTDNPDLIVEIGSHTDARGTVKYNRKLSQRRAESVVKWLVNNGIKKDRLKAVGYGESTPVNGCVDGVKCSEDDHQRNRRTEFKVLGTIYGKKYDEGVKSVAPKDVKTDKCTNCSF